MTSFSEKIINGIHHPLRFLGRQVYRLLIIIPYEIIAVITSKISLSINNNIEKPDVKTCVFISSLIYCKDRKLTYGVRSAFSPEKRAEQTLQTISSIRRYIPNAVVVLIEAGLRKDVPENVIGAVDRYIYVGDNKIVRAACDSRFKSLGEAALLINGFKYLPKAERYFKISGRYWVNENFSENAWKGSGINFYYIRQDFVSTRLYSFTNAAERYWRWSLIKSLPYMLLDYPIEYLLPKFIPSATIQKVSLVGISGHDGVTGNVIEE